MVDSARLDLVQYQRRLFSVLEEFFQRATGDGIEAVGGASRFPEWVRTNAKGLGARALDASEWVRDALAPLYEQARTQGLYGRIREQAGVKLVFGGGSRFTAAHLAATRRVLLYADTILIPDPVMPWIEAPRRFEKFPNALLLQAAFMLLHLKPLIDADLPYPAVLVFPSWEKSLESADSDTQAGQEGLVTGVVGTQLGIEASTLTELRDYLVADPARGLEAIERNRLFVAPDTDLPLADVIEGYRAYLGEWRADQFVKVTDRMHDVEVAFLGICELLYPQYHLLENAETLGAHPLLPIEAHAHYFMLVSGYLGDRVQRLGFLDERTLAEMRALKFDEFQWLGDIPIDALVTLRANGDNEEFRARLREQTQVLAQASLEEIDQVAGQVTRGISSLMRDHQKHIREIDAKYNRKDLQTVLAGGITTAAPLVPALGPFIGGTALLAPVGKLVWDRVSEAIDRKKAAGSLMGVLATAHLKKAP